MFDYILELKLENSQNIINSNRKTGFLGFLCCIRYIEILYRRIILDTGLIFVPIYKLSQDHLECFFSAIRAKGGFNNNPSALQFKAAYKRLVVHGELKHIQTGNCCPLENINIMTYTYTKFERKINSTLIKLQNIVVDNDHYYLYSGLCYKKSVDAF